MPTKDKRVDEYIAESAVFARPVLLHLRKLVHKAVPGVEETMRWNFPHFDYHGTLCSMAAFKEHCAFGFWKASLMADPENVLGERGEEAMGHFGRITDLGNLPSDRVLMAYLKEAAKLNEDGVKAPKRKKARTESLKVPDLITQALKKNKKAQATFEGFSTSHKREYVDWISEAKTSGTTEKRLATALEWMAEGKSRNWKYMRK